MTGAVKGFGPGYIDVQLDRGSYWVREAVAPTGWSVIETVAYGSSGATVQGNKEYVGLYQVTSSRTDTDWFVNRRNNNPYPPVCGLKVALVFDFSNSIDNTEFGQMTLAGQGFVDALKGTPSEFALYYFGTTASTELVNGSLWTSVATDAGATAVKTEIGTWTRGKGATNWDAAFLEVAGDGAQVIIVLTDGNPTTYGDGSVDGADVHLIDVERGVASANNAKQGSASPKLVAVGIGDALGNPTNLKLISGPTAYDPSANDGAGNALEADYYLTSFDKLNQALFQIAAALCGGTVTVKKEVKVGGTWTGVEGWQFTATAQGATDPNPGTDDTDSEGLTIAFDYDNTGTVKAVIKETDARLGSGWDIVPQEGKNALCTKNGGAAVDETDTDDNKGVKFDLGPKDIVICTFQDRLNTGKLEVKKALSPTTDPGLFNLQIDGSTAGTGANVGHNGTTGEQALNTGTHSVGETAGTGTSLATTQLHRVQGRQRHGCRRRLRPGAGPLDVSVTSGSDIVCVITNTRDTGKLEVKKALSPTTDPGLFNLQIDGSTAGTGANVGHNGTTGEQALNTGTHSVGETAGTGTSLADYSSSIECKADNGTGAVVASGQGAGPLDVSVTSGSDIVCVITNTRDTGKLEVKKALSPTTDPGLFNLRIDGSTAGTGANVGHNGTTGEQALNTGTHSVGETAGTGTSLADYSSSIVCKADNGTGAVVASGQGAGPLDVSVTSGSDIVCVITNTRDTGKLEVKKALSPTTDPGLFNLRIDGSTAGTGANVGHNGTTGEQALNTGTHSVGETAGTGTEPGRLRQLHRVQGRQRHGCRGRLRPGAGPLDVDVTSGSDIVCVITNTRDTGKLEVKKNLAPTTTSACSTCRSTARPPGPAPTSGTTARPASRPSTPAPHRR